MSWVFNRFANTRLWQFFTDPFGLDFSIMLCLLFVSEFDFVYILEYGCLGVADVSCQSRVQH